MNAADDMLDDVPDGMDDAAHSAGDVHGTHELAGALDDSHGAGAPLPDADFADAHGGTVIGRDDDGGVWDLQDTGFTCAVVSQKMILDEFGIDVSEAHLMGEAMENGWLTANGTNPADIGELLELHGVPCHQGEGPEWMLQELSQGHKVIVGVDADELWYDSPIAHELQDMGGGIANHALVIQGVKHGADGSWSAVVNDPGDPDGAGREYPMDQFMDAWQDSRCSYVATDAAPPGLANNPEIGESFDAATGTYEGMWDWVVEHSDWLAEAARDVGIGLAAGVAIPLAILPAKPPPLSEQERNDRLRDA